MIFKIILLAALLLLTGSTLKDAVVSQEENKV
jgi:hypothetical protein